MVFFRQRMLQKCTGVKQQRKKEIEKIVKSWGHPCIPCARLTRVTIRDGSENKGAELVRGGEGQIRGAKGYRRISCNHLQSDCISVTSPGFCCPLDSNHCKQKSLFLTELKSICIVIPFHPAHISWHKGAAHPLLSTVSLHSPPLSYLTPACYTVHY